jgi:hypothetical protein
VCETWSLTLKAEYRLRALGNTVLRKIFAPKREKVTGGCGNLHNEMLHIWYYTPSTIRINKSKRIRYAGYIP